MKVYILVSQPTGYEGRQNLIDEFAPPLMRLFASEDEAKTAAIAEMQEIVDNYGSDPREALEFIPPMYADDDSLKMPEKLEWTPGNPSFPGLGCFVEVWDEHDAFACRFDIVCQLLNLN